MDIEFEKTSVLSKSRAKSGRFIKRCCRSFHGENKSTLHDYETQRRLPRGTFVYWKRMVLFICNKSKCTCSRCLSKCCVSWSSSEQQNDTINININEHSDNEIIPDNVENLETGKPELDKQEMRAVTEQDIKDLYHNRDNNHPKILTSYLANLWLKQRPKEIVSFLADISILTPKKKVMTINWLF